jgi:hypothetical protein
VAVDFRLRNPTAHVQTSEDLAKELAGDVALRAALAQVVTFAKESCLSFSVHSTLSHGDTLFLTSNGCFALLDELAVYFARARPVDLRKGAVEYLWPELLRDVATLRDETDRLHTELSRAAVSLSSANAQKRDEVRAVTIEGDAKIQHVQGQYARLSDEYHILLRDREVAARDLEERTTMLEVERKKCEEMRKELLQTQESLRQAQSESHNQLQIRDMKVGALLKENEAIRYQLAETFEEAKANAAAADKLQAQLNAIIASRSPSKTNEASPERPMSPVPQPQPTVPTAQPLVQSPSAPTINPVLEQEYRAQISQLQAMLTLQQREALEARGDARCSQDALAALESELGRLREDNRTLRQKASLKKI